MEGQIVWLLSNRGELTAAEIAEALGVPRHRVMKALRLLYFKGVVEPVKRGRGYYWRLAGGHMAVIPLHLTLRPVLYLEGVIEPVYRRSRGRVNAFIFVHVRGKTFWLCDCDTGYFIATDEPIAGCNCKMKHAFGSKKLGMIYLPRDLYFRYWRSYKYDNGDVEFVLLVPDSGNSPHLVHKYESYVRGATQQSS